MKSLVKDKAEQIFQDSNTHLTQKTHLAYNGIHKLEVKG